MARCLPCCQTPDAAELVLEHVAGLEPRLEVVLELLEGIVSPRERHRPVYGSALPAVTRRLKGSKVSGHASAASCS